MIRNLSFTEILNRMLATIWTQLKASWVVGSDVKLVDLLGLHQSRPKRSLYWKDVKKERKEKPAKILPSTRTDIISVSRIQTSSYYLQPLIRWSEKLTFPGFYLTTKRVDTNTAEKSDTIKILQIRCFISYYTQNNSLVSDIHNIKS